MADLIELSANHAISDVALVTGDGDLVIGIEMAQKHGVRVALLGIEDAEGGVSHNQSFEVVCIADRVLRIGRSRITPFFSTTPVAAKKAGAKSTPASKTANTAKAKAATSPKKATAAPKKSTAPVKATTPTPAVPIAASDQVLLEIVNQFIETAAPPLDGSSLRETGAIGPTVDGKLLQAATTELARKPMPNERSRLRVLFREKLMRATE